MSRGLQKNFTATGHKKKDLIIYEEQVPDIKMWDPNIGIQYITSDTSMVIYSWAPYWRCVLDILNYKERHYTDSYAKILADSHTRDGQ